VPYFTYLLYSLVPPQSRDKFLIFLKHTALREAFVIALAKHASFCYNSVENKNAAALWVRQHPQSLHR
jgi:hypothetical protein